MNIEVYSRQHNPSGQVPSYMVIIDNKHVYVIGTKENAPPAYLGETPRDIRNPTTGMYQVNLIPSHILSSIADAVVAHVGGGA